MTGRLAALSLMAGAAALLLGASISAQPTGGNVMTDVSVKTAGGCNTVVVHFNVPIRYMNHFPHGRGNELRIQLKPLAVSSVDAQSILGREAFSPLEGTTALSDVIYEGDMDGGPYLSLQFNRNVHFMVAQGTDFRSMNIYFGDDAASCSATSMSTP